MSEKKAVKQSIRAVWDKVKLLRSESSKLYAPADIDASADILESCAADLRDLAKQMSSLRAMPPVEPPTPAATRKQKRKVAE